MALVKRIIILLLLISEISSLRFEPHTGGGMIFFSNHDSKIKNLEKIIEIWKAALNEITAQSLQLNTSAESIKTKKSFSLIGCPINDKPYKFLAICCQPCDCLTIA